MRKNEELEAALSELADAGIHDVTHAYGGRHIQIRWQGRGTGTAGERVYTVPSTPSDVRGPANARAGIRRILREDGMLLVESAKPSAPRTPDRATMTERRVAELESTVAELKSQVAALLNSALEIGLCIPAQAPIQH